MAIKLNDHTTFQITKMLYNEFEDEQNEKKLDQDNLDQFKKEYIKPLYPHKVQFINGEKVLKKYSCEQFCCKLSPGYFFCCDSTYPDDQYRKFGLGACLYFKFIRHMMLFFILLAILCLFSVLLYYMVSINNGFKITQNYQNFVFAGTIGSLSAQRTLCYYDQVISNTSIFLLQCHEGTIQTYGRPVGSIQTKNSLQNCRKQIDKISQEATQYYLTGTTQNQSCNSDRTICNITVTNINTQYQYVSYPFQCKNSTYVVGSLILTQQIIVYITVSIDLGIIFFFMLFLISQNNAEKKQQQYFKGKQLALHDFSLKIQGFNSASFDYQFDFLLKGMKQEVQGMEGFSQNIVQVKKLETKQIRSAIQSRRQCYQKLYDFIDYCFFEQMINPNKYQSSQDFIKRCFGSNQQPQYIQYKKQLAQYLNSYAQSKQIVIKNQKGSQVSCYLVMSNPKFKKKIYETANSSCFTKYLKVQQRQYPISDPPVADMVLWENLNRWTTLRAIIIWIITLAIIFCSYLLVGVAQEQKQVIRQNNNFQIDCDLVFTVQQRQTYNNSITTLGYTHCYCLYLYFELFDYSDHTHCDKWHSDYLLYLGIPILISLGIVLYNLIVSRIFKLMTKYECHDELTVQLYSYIIKRTLVLVMNMGLLMIILKFEYPGTFGGDTIDFLFHGTYHDVTADWYLQIGVIITLTLCLNIFIPILQMLFFSFLRWLRKVWDRRCCCRKTSQKTKKGFLQLYSGDVYPIEERYADLLSVVIITLGFSAVMPGLYIIACFSLIFMFICDKLLLFRVYQHPVNYTANLQSKVFKTIYFALIIHCAGSAFLLSEPNLLVGVTNTFFLNNLQTGSSRIDTLFRTNYIIPYVVFFCILFIWGLLNATIISLIKYCRQKFKKHEMSQIRRVKLNTNFYDALDDYQVHRIKLSLEREVNKKFQTIMKKDNYMRQNDTQNYFLKGSDKVHERQIICRKTLLNLEKRQKNKKQNTKQRQTKLIGKANYQQLYDDQIFNRERKIRILDQNLKDIIKKSIQEKSKTQVAQIQQQRSSQDQIKNQQGIHIQQVQIVIK